MLRWKPLFPLLAVLLYIGWRQASWYSRPPTPFPGQTVESFTIYDIDAAPPLTDAQLAKVRHASVSGPQIQRLFQSCTRCRGRWVRKADWPAVVKLANGQYVSLTCEHSKVHVHGIGWYRVPHSAYSEWMGLTVLLFDALDDGQTLLSRETPTTMPGLPPGTGYLQRDGRRYSHHVPVTNESGNPLAIRCKWLDVDGWDVTVPANETVDLLVWDFQFPSGPDFEICLIVTSSRDVCQYELLMQHVADTKLIEDQEFEPRLSLRAGELTMIWESGAGDRIERVFQPVSVEVRDTTTQPGS